VQGGRAMFQFKLSARVSSAADAIEAGAAVPDWNGFHPRTATWTGPITTAVPGLPPTAPTVYHERARGSRRFRRPVIQIENANYPWRNSVFVSPLRNQRQLDDD